MEAVVSPNPEQTERKCPVCAGCGEVVKPVIVYNHQTKSDDLVDRAVPCDSCGGSGRVWVTV
jgi:RecJ-like exonuclease